MTLTTRLYTFFNGTLVGTDAGGNRYFTEKHPRRGMQERRWVLYAHRGREPSAVPPDWHGWLHHSTDTPPNRQHRAHYGWEKPPVANATGTANAYLPAGHLQKSAHHAPTIAQVEVWRP